MKKLFGLAGLILVFSLITFATQAQTAVSDNSTKVQNQQSGQTVKGTFTDTNKDGICDNQQNKAKNGNCTQFVDKNGDGKCDNCTGNGPCVKGKCCGKGNPQGNCCPKGSGKGCGMQHQYRHGPCTQGKAVQPETK